jgi:hypothetical protein
MVRSLGSLNVQLLGDDMTTTTAARSTTRSAVLAVAVTAVAAGVANLAISLIAQAMGADASVFAGLAPVVFIPFTVIGTVAGVAGWIVVRRRAERPAAVLRWLVPAVVAVTLLADVAVGVGLGWGGAVALGLMHIAVAVIAVPVFGHFLPLSPR